MQFMLCMLRMVVGRSCRTNAAHLNLARRLRCREHQGQTSQTTNDYKQDTHCITDHHYIQDKLKDKHQRQTFRRHFVGNQPPKGAFEPLVVNLLYGV